MEPIIDNPDVVGAAKAIFDGIANKNWFVVAFGLVILLVMGIRFFGAKISPKLGTFLNHPVVAFSLPSAVSTLGAVMLALLAGQPMSAALSAGFKVASAAVLAYVGYKKVQEARSDAKAASEAAVTDKAAALNVLRGPNP